MRAVCGRLAGDGEGAGDENHSRQREPCIQNRGGGGGKREHGVFREERSPRAAGMRVGERETHARRDGGGGSQVGEELS